MEINNKYINKILDSKPMNKMSKYHQMMTKVAAILLSSTITM
jgi:NurA-like 5'-3' nuclease